MQSKHPLQDMLEPEINRLGFDVVRILTIGQKNPTLQIMIERKDRTDIVVEDCATVSRAVSEILDEKDPIKDQYNLEVSSPGLDRPLTVLERMGYSVCCRVESQTADNRRASCQVRGDSSGNRTVTLFVTDLIKRTKCKISKVCPDPKLFLWPIP